MASSTALNVPSLPSSSRSSPSLSLPNCSSHVLATSLNFLIPKKRTHISCIGRRGSVFVHPVKRHEMGYTPQYAAETDRMVAKAAEVSAPTTEVAVSRQSKSSTKGKGDKYPRRMIDMYQILKYPIITEAAVKNVAEENSLLFTVDVRADKKMIKEAVNNFFGVKVRKVNTSIRPDGTKKAFIMLSKEYNASDIAKSIGIFPGSD